MKVKQTRHGHRRSVKCAPNRSPTEDHASPAVRVPPNQCALSLRVVSCGTATRPESDAEHNLSHEPNGRAVILPATFRRAGPLCLSPPSDCSQRYSVLGGLLIRRPHTPLKLTSDHTGLYLLTRERLQSSDVFLRPRTQFRSLRHLSSLSTTVADHRRCLKTKRAPNLQRSRSVAPYHEQSAYHAAVWITVASLKRTTKVTSKATRSCRSCALAALRESTHRPLVRYRLKRGPLRRQSDNAEAGHTSAGKGNPMPLSPGRLPVGGFAPLVPELDVIDLEASLRFWCGVRGSL